MKPILTTPETVELYFENFNQLGEAILKSGGNCFPILKRHDELLRTLAANNISITAKYNLLDDKNEESKIEIPGNTEYYVDPERFKPKPPKEHNIDLGNRITKSWEHL